MPVHSVTSKQTYEQLWRSRDTVGTTLLVMVLDSYGQEMFEMDPQAFRQELEEGFGVSDIPAVSTDKVWALWHSLTSDLVHKDVSTFMNTANVLSGTPLSYDVFDIADVYECAWAVTELTMLDSSTSERLSPEVRRYIGEACKEQGLYRPPLFLAKAADMGVDDLAAVMESHAGEDSAALQVMVQNQLDFQADVQAYVDRRTAKMMLELNNVPLLNKDSGAWNKFVQNFANGANR
jgi:hypothetical protein